MRGHAIFAVLCGCTAAAPQLATQTQADTACADGPTIRGMDVSYWESSVDWDAAHADGIDFAFVRVSDGDTYLDPKFDEYWAGAKAAGVIRGAYQFFRPAEDPIAQADLLLQHMGPLDKDDLPPVIDVEVSGGLSQSEVAARVRAWVDHVAAATGRTPIVYAGLYSWHDLTGSADMTTSPLWVAQYTSAACPNIPTPWTRWTFWQDTATGSAAGVPGSGLDLDLFNGTRDDLIALAEGTPPPACAPLAGSGGTIDDGDPCFTSGGPPAYLRHVSSAGFEDSLVWTHATASDHEANFAQWNLVLAEAGRYRVEAYTAHAFATATTATYVVHAGGADTAATIDQTAADGWQPLGEFDFAAGGDQWIHLGDNTGQPATADAQLVFDAMRVTRLDEPTPPEPPPADGGCTTSGGAGGLVGLGLFAISSRARTRARRATAARRRSR